MLLPPVIMTESSSAMAQASLRGKYCLLIYASKDIEMKETYVNPYCKSKSFLVFPVAFSTSSAVFNIPIVESRPPKSTTPSLDCQEECLYLLVISLCVSVHTPPVWRDIQLSKYFGGLVYFRPPHTIFPSTVWSFLFSGKSGKLHLLVTSPVWGSISKSSTDVV